MAPGNRPQRCIQLQYARSIGSWTITSSFASGSSYIGLSLSVGLASQPMGASSRTPGRASAEGSGSFAGAEILRFPFAARDDRA